MLKWNPSIHFNGLDVIQRPLSPTRCSDLNQYVRLIRLVAFPRFYRFVVESESKQVVHVATVHVPESNTGQLGQCLTTGTIWIDRMKLSAVRLPSSFKVDNASRCPHRVFIPRRIKPMVADLQQPSYFVANKFVELAL